MSLLKRLLYVGLCTGLLYANEFSEAVEAYREGNYIQALNTFYKLAKEDDAKAQYNVGLFYAKGLGVQQDRAEAQKWYEKAAKQGNGAAQYNLAQLYHTEGLKDKYAYAKAKYWYEKAVEADIKEAYNNLGTLYLQGNGTPKDEQKAFELFRKGAAKGDSAAEVNAAILYAWGEEVTLDKMKAYEYLRKALKSGQSRASQYLDKLCQESAWVCKD